MNVQVGWKGLNGAIKAFSGVEPIIARSMGGAIRRSTNSVRRDVRAAAPRGRHRGAHRVRQGVSARVTGAGMATVGRVRLTGIAIIVARGSKPHEIKPRGRALKLPDGGFLARADVTGTRPNDFFQRGVERSLPSVERELNVVGADVLDFVGRRIDEDK